jgi:hypothetical protein
MTMTNRDPFYIPASGNLMDLLKDEAWMKAAIEDEALVEGCVWAGPVKAIGWMQTWPELYTYSHYEQLRSLVVRGFAAMLKEGELSGMAYDAALACGKPLLKERLMVPTDEVKVQLLGLMDVTRFGPPLELTTERLGVLKSVLRVVLGAEDWRAIALATAARVERQVMAIVG